MKKLIALLLCCSLCICLLAACGSDEPETDVTEAVASVATPSDIETAASASEAPTEATEAPEEHEHAHINYKGLETADFTLDDVAAVEGREPDFSFPVGDSTYYAYNDVTLGSLTFGQVQFSFTETGNHISCTCKYEGDPTAVVDEIREAMTAEFGEPTGSDNSYSWLDGHTANHLRLTVLNDDTVQLAFDILEGK